MEQSIVDEIGRERAFYLAQKAVIDAIKENRSMGIDRKSSPLPTEAHMQSQTKIWADSAYFNKKISLV